MVAMNLLFFLFVFFPSSSVPLFYQSSYNCKVIIVLMISVIITFVSGKGPEFKWQKKYILSVTRNVLTQENRQNCVIRLCIMRCN